MARRPSRAARSSGRKQARVPRPTDWLLFLAPVATEIAGVVELVRRLRWAYALARRGIAVAPWPAGAFKARSAGMPSAIKRLRTPEEMAASVPKQELKRQ